ncbi:MULTISPECIES: hypothetical protein [unclassified Lysobacter]|uniref:hypothetical protein n=1 Tax=unclassified Lysobacter TaxID=2635362 RepID=UPI0006F95420|nr:MULTISPECIES: hypothetical protein [unclassified Lysobacter]KRC31538.1 hypothetical protein ASE10_17585 [Lysobacter sp. Root76]KRD65445.1 hypothetical protein ASE45_18780 [Lysobacter sp. Root96]
MGHALLAFVKWFFAAAIVGVVAGGILGGMMGTDVDSSRQAGRMLGAFIWPTVLVVAIAGTVFSVSREKKRHAQALAGPRISDQYRHDRDHAA